MFIYSPIKCYLFCSISVYKNSSSETKSEGGQLPISCKKKILRRKCKCSDGCGGGKSQKVEEGCVG